MQEKKNEEKYKAIDKWPSSGEKYNLEERGRGKKKATGQNIHGTGWKVMQRINPFWLSYVSDIQKSNYVCS